MPRIVELNCAVEQSGASTGAGGGALINQRRDKELGAPTRMGGRLLVSGSQQGSAGSKTQESKITKQTSKGYYKHIFSMFSSESIQRKTSSVPLNTRSPGLKRLKHSDWVMHRKEMPAHMVRPIRPPPGTCSRPDFATLQSPSTGPTHCTHPKGPTLATPTEVHSTASAGCTTYIVQVRKARCGFTS